MDLTIPSKNDKDAQIEFLKNALIEVKDEVSCLYTPCRCKDCHDNFFSDFNVVDTKVSDIIDFIGKRLIDVTY